MTAHLISLTYPPDQKPTAPSSRLFEAVDREARKIGDALAPMRLRRPGTEDRENDVLRDIVARAALLGLNMFSQQSPTEFFWLKKGEIFPGIRQRSVDPRTADTGPWVTVRPPQM
jgi:hypothetical protein